VDLLIAVPHHLYHEFVPPVLLPQIPHPIGPQPEGGDDGEAGSIDEGDGGSVVARGRDEGGDGGGETKVAVAAHLGSQEEGDGQCWHDGNDGKDEMAGTTISESAPRVA
jgi:hypothetical protein